MTRLRSFYNDSYDTVFLVAINGDEGSFLLVDINGEAEVFSSWSDAMEALEESGDIGDVLEVEYHETLDLDLGW